MCGRFTIYSDDKTLEKRFRAKVKDPLVRHYNAAPAQRLPIIINQDPQDIRLGIWGLRPKWLKDKSGTGLINARVETLTEKPSFREAYKARRCLVLADSFFEWDRLGGTRRPYRILLDNGQPFAFAGIWELAKTRDGLLIPSFAILTTQPNNLISPLHNRMPVILPPGAEDIWLDPLVDVPKELDIKTPYPADKMQVYPVSALVNSYANDTPEVIAKF